MGRGGGGLWDEKIEGDVRKENGVVPPVYATVYYVYFYLQKLNMQPWQQLV